MGGCRGGRPTTYSATSARRCNTVNDNMGTQLVDNLIRLVAADGRARGATPAFPRVCAEKRRRCAKMEISGLPGGAMDAGMTAAENGERSRRGRFRHQVRASTPGKEKGPRRCRGPISNSNSGQAEPPPLSVPPPPMNRQNQPMINLLSHCPRGTVNEAYTLISKVNRVLTISIAASLAATPCGAGEGR